MYIKIGYPSIKRKIINIAQTAKGDIVETTSYYSENAKYGWERGRKLAKFQHRNPITSFAIKTLSTAANTRIRVKDTIPLISCVIFSFSNPIPGMGAVGFALGKTLNTKIVNGLKSLKSLLVKVK